MNKQLKLSFHNISKYRTELYGISIFWIMLFHFEGKYPYWAKCFLNYGNMGCELFIFASGVSLYYAMQKKPTLSRYIERRLLRVLLPVFLICSWEWVILYLREVGKPSFFKLIVRLLCVDFWITGDQQIWFLSFIMSAYLFYPYIYSFLFEKKGKVWAKTLFLLFLAMLLTFCMRIFSPVYFNLTEIALTRGPIFIIGCAFGSCVFQKREIKNALGWYISLIILISSTFFALNYQLVSGTYRRYFYIIPGISLSIFLPQMLAIGSNFYKYRLLPFLGNSSIELYLIHILLGKHIFPYIRLYNRENLLHYLIMLVISIIITIPISRINRYLSEKIGKFL